VSCILFNLCLLEKLLEKTSRRPAASRRQSAPRGRLVISRASHVENKVKRVRRTRARCVRERDVRVPALVLLRSEQIDVDAGGESERRRGAQRRVHEQWVERCRSGRAFDDETTVASRARDVEER